MKPTKQGQLLLRVMMQLVEKELAGQGLRTFAAVVARDREVQLLVPETIKEHPSLEEIDKYWIAQLRSKMAAGHCEAAGYCTDIGVATEDGQPITRGVLVFVEQPRANAEYRFYPYEKHQDSTVTMGEPTVEETPLRLFASEPPTDANKRSWWRSWR